MQLYRPGERVDWPATEDGNYARRYLEPLMERGPEAFIRNAHTGLYALRAGHRNN